MVTYMSPLGGTCTRASQDGLTYSCSMYTCTRGICWIISLFRSWYRENTLHWSPYFSYYIISSLPSWEGICTLSHTAL